MAELEASLSEAELREWIAFYGMEPFGEQASYYRTGIVASLIYNTNRGKGGKTMKPADFMPKPKRAGRVADGDAAGLKAELLSLRPKKGG